MDTVYNYHSPYVRRSNRSLQNLNHLSLAPLSLRMPLSDPESLSELNQPGIKPQSRSAQVTPSTLCRSSHSPARTPSKTGFPKSKSSTYLMSLKTVPNLVMTTGDGNSYQCKMREETRLDSISHRDWNDSDWLLRTGAILASSARESKGQAWLASRASSISLVKLKDSDHKEWVQDHARERKCYSGRSSNRGSMFGGFDDDFSSPRTPTSSNIDPNSGRGSLPTSRLASRVMSRSGSKAQLFSTPLVANSDSYFDYKSYSGEEPYVEETNFLGIEAGLDEEVEQQDEATIKKLAKDYSQGLGGWIEKMLGWRLLANSGIGETDSGTEDECEVEDDIDSRNQSGRDLSIPQGLDLSTHSIKVDLPPAEDGEISAWRDAAWILSVAAKVLL
ncbi:hypothetical protein EPUL_000297 [Erysiphe pulchra]|uniref:Uncharacterized protein n=1 Tax=Erysiphe pulchra TaxID=225359 RepID=A0A2S4Q1B8_9PEZI|nr:hypothetical protein EPUL_000297 [Erysiphe pulchra]